MVSVVGAHPCRSGDRNQLSPAVAPWCCCRCCRSSYRYRVGGRAATATVVVNVIIVVVPRMYDRYLYRWFAFQVRWSVDGGTSEAALFGFGKEVGNEGIGDLAVPRRLAAIWKIGG